MTHALSDSDRHHLSRTWSSVAPSYLDEVGVAEVDAIWVPASHRNPPMPAAFLHCQGLDADRRRLTALGLPNREVTPRQIRLPLEEAVFLCHSSLPPLTLATVTSADPWLSVPGESEALRIRCLAGIPPFAPLPPTVMAAGIPGLRLEVVREATPGLTTSTFTWTPQGLVLEVERDPYTLKPRESSVGLALAAWFCSRSPFGIFDVQWPEPDCEEDPATPFRRQVLATYQALRLPAVVLSLVLRAVQKRKIRPLELLSASHFDVPSGLLRERIQALRAGRT